MRAVVQDVYGDAGVLHLRDVDRPTPGPGEVLVRVVAAGVDPGVWHMMTGRPWAMRPVTGMRTPKIPVRGRDLAGVVEAVGPGVSGFQPGDEVYGTTSTGSFAEFATARADRIAAKPAGVSFEQAAVVPVSGTTALQAVRDVARVRSGQRVLVIGAGGGIGSFAVPLATEAGAEVTGVCSAGKADLVRSLGAVDVLDYRTEEVDTRGPVFDVIIDVAGNRPLSLLRRALTPRGTLVLVGGEARGTALLGGLSRSLIAAPLSSMFSGRRLVGLIAKENAADLRVLADLLEKGTLRPCVERTFPLSGAAEAVRLIGSGHSRGKLVVTV
ncbi:NADPH:quinone reductase [Actinoplanes ianthinogenes]|uniref:NADPH:quinone reductase n=1 Tax=Actinoplanes ianthinogenes TaxID=122358 RepID=A0ABM7LQ38_9ACTN|nr:NAD(P)-dependent alcohol dehydrogenase [Actinoplanes ianthinogenes]BCJ41344.1 NADPH:quinone reductase [Actinoplanes ianthinogenes]GGR56290.1 NADPH:quinone reductase [Actinoplanes ianthinogenes]